MGLRSMCWVIGSGVTLLIACSSGDRASGAGSAKDAGAAATSGHSQQVTAPGTCSDDDLPQSFSDYTTPLQYVKKGTTTGTNGTFEDRCGDGGVLIEQMCAQSFGCFAPPGADCAPRNMPTGMVIEQPVECFGMCMDGVCIVPCPEVGDSLTVSFSGQLYELKADGGPSYLCRRDDACPLMQAASQVLTVTRGVPEGLPSQPRSCLMTFAPEYEPLQLSDGCNYFNCTTLAM